MGLNIFIYLFRIHSSARSTDPMDKVHQIYFNLEVMQGLTMSVSFGGSHDHRIPRMSINLHFLSPLGEYGGDRWSNLEYFTHIKEYLTA